MKLRNVVLTLGFLTASVGVAQGPLYDRVQVSLPYPVTVNGTVLQPGDYEIRQHESTAGGSRIVHFFKDGGMKLETTAMAIPTLDNRTPEETKLVLDRFGSDYYLNKIWVQGKDYGYEFPIPDSVRMRENERNTAASVNATYQPAPAATTETAQTTTTTVERTETERTETAQVTPPPAEPAPAPAEAAPAPAPQVEAAPAPAPAPMAADRPAQTMPATAGNWLNLLLGGGLLTGSGLALRRFRA